MTVIDTLKLARALRDQGGMPGPQAEAVSAALADAFTDQVATKADVDRLDAKIEALRTELKGDIESLRVELKGDIGQLAARLNFQQWQLGAILAILVALLVKLVVFSH
jgi:hypothetical protein